MTQQNPQEIVDALADMSLVVGALADNASHIAHARRSLYNAYLAEGFTEAQALELCRRLTLT
jgi:hypothetical protein